MIIYAHRAQYRPGETVRIVFESPTIEPISALPAATTVRVSVLSPDREDLIRTYPMPANGGSIEIGTFPEGGYLVVCTTTPADRGLGEKESGGAHADTTATCAFDVSARASEYVRYGFLSRFDAPHDETCGDPALRQLLLYRINTVQFYDWMFRHHELVPPDSSSDSFQDAMGRTVSLAAVKRRIRLCHEAGMNAIAYGAVYGAESEYIDTRPEQRLYKNDGTPFAFIEKIALCNIDPANSWSRHIVDQYEVAVRKLGFDGIHMDQYGYPRVAYDHAGNLVDMDTAFAELIDATRSRIDAVHPDPTIFFNAVNDWPTARVAVRGVHAIYIEVWDPHSTYAHLYRLIREARLVLETAGLHKTVVLAAYIHAFNEVVETSRAMATALMTTAVIAASGGSHLLWGEYCGALAEGYYVNHGRYDEAWVPRIRAYMDFVTAYRDLLYAPRWKDAGQDRAGGVNEDFAIENPGLKLCPDFSDRGIGITVRVGNAGMVVNLVNLTGGELLWNKARDFPEVVHDLTLVVLPDRPVREILWASPDDDTMTDVPTTPETAYGVPRRIGFETVRHPQGTAVRFTIPRLFIWDLVYLRYES